MSEEQKHICPQCGKPMVENPQWLGVWFCPDYIEPINDRAPFKYKCEGLEISDAAADECDADFMRMLCQRN